MTKALKSALKEAGRLVVIAILPVLVVAVGDLNPAWAGVAIIVLRSVEKYAHKVGSKVALSF